MDITSAGGNNATRRQGGSGETWRRRRGEGEKGLFPREGTICRENFKNATPWSGRNEISQRILIRLRPAGRRGRSIQIIWPSRPPREMRGRRVSCECRCQGKRTSYVSHGRRYPLDEISRTVRMPRVIGFDGFTWWTDLPPSGIDLFDLLTSIDSLARNFSRNRFIIWTININLSGFTLVYFY